MLGTGPTQERRIENADPNVAVVVSTTAEQAIRELRRVQHAAVIVVLPVGGGASAVADHLGGSFAAEGRRLVVVEVADVSAAVDWRALLYGSEAVTGPAEPNPEVPDKPKRKRSAKPE